MTSPVKLSGMETRLGRPGWWEPWGVDVAGRAEDSGGHAEKGHKKALTGTRPPSPSPSSPSD